MKLLMRIGCFFLGHQFKENWITLDVGIQSSCEMCTICGAIK